MQGAGYRVQGAGWCDLKGVDMGRFGVEWGALAVGPDVVVGIPRGEALAGAVLDIAYP